MRSGPAFNFPAAGSEHRTRFRANHGVGLIGSVWDIANTSPMTSWRSIGLVAGPKRRGPGNATHGMNRSWLGTRRCHPAAGTGRWRSRLLHDHRRTAQVTQVCSPECKEMVSLQKEIYVCADAGCVLCAVCCLSQSVCLEKEKVPLTQRKEYYMLCPTGTRPRKKTTIRFRFHAHACPSPCHQRPRQREKQLMGPISTKYGAAVGLRFGISMRPMPMDH